MGKFPRPLLSFGISDVWCLWLNMNLYDRYSEIKGLLDVLGVQLQLGTVLIKLWCEMSSNNAPICTKTSHKLFILK